MQSITNFSNEDVLIMWSFLVHLHEKSIFFIVFVSVPDESIFQLIVAGYLDLVEQMAVGVVDATEAVEKCEQSGASTVLSLKS